MTPDLGSLAAGGDDLAELVAEARAGLAARQQADGHWVFELEADATIPAEYVLLEHFLGEIDQALEDKIAVYLRAWPGRPWRLAAVSRAAISTSAPPSRPTMRSS